LPNNNTVIILHKIEWTKEQCQWHKWSRIFQSRAYCSTLNKAQQFKGFTSSPLNITLETQPLIKSDTDVLNCIVQYYHAIVGRFTPLMQVKTSGLLTLESVIVRHLEMLNVKFNALAHMAISIRYPLASNHSPK